MKIKMLLSVLVFGMLAHAAQAELLAGWDAQGAMYKPKGETIPREWSQSVSKEVGVVTVAPGMEIRKGLRFAGNRRLRVLNSAWGVQGIHSHAHEKAAVAADSYLSFTLAPKDGRRASYESITMHLRALVGTGIDYVWQYQIGDGDFVTIDGSKGSHTGIGANGAALPAVNLRAVAALQKVAAPVTFRMVVWRNDGEHNGIVLLGRLKGNDLAVYGEVQAQ